MLFAIARRDKPGMGDARVALLAAHAEYQKAFMDQIVFGGGLMADGADLDNFVYSEAGIRDVVGNVLIVDVPDIVSIGGGAHGVAIHLRGHTLLAALGAEVSGVTRSA